ncbi:hypothetical protein TWF694_010249 [Orbilia ellipsospora]|uniref:Inner kinetochore subunit AME1 domain-containing protein n=1 Tax=Orbilia ellipsospora TaxID=2528407 RepID=A0AAV9X9B0_9PEZI
MSDITRLRHEERMAERRRGAGNRVVTQTFGFDLPLITATPPEARAPKPIETTEPINPEPKEPSAALQQVVEETQRRRSGRLSRGASVLSTSSAQDVAAERDESARKRRRLESHSPRRSISSRRSASAVIETQKDAMSNGIPTPQIVATEAPVEGAAVEPVHSTPINRTTPRVSPRRISLALEPSLGLSSPSPMPPKGSQLEVPSSVSPEPLRFIPEIPADEVAITPEAAQPSAEPTPATPTPVSSGLRSARGRRSKPAIAATTPVPRGKRRRQPSPDKFVTPEKPPTPEPEDLDEYEEEPTNITIDQSIREEIVDTPPAEEEELPAVEDSIVEEDIIEEEVVEKLPSKRRGRKPKAKKLFAKEVIPEEPIAEEEEIVEETVEEVTEEIIEEEVLEKQPLKRRGRKPKTKKLSVEIPYDDLPVVEEAVLSDVEPEEQEVDPDTSRLEVVDEEDGDIPEVEDEELEEVGEEDEEEEAANSRPLSQARSQKRAPNPSKRGRQPGKSKRRNENGELKETFDITVYRIPKQGDLNLKFPKQPNNIQIVSEFLLGIIDKQLDSLSLRRGEEKDREERARMKIRQTVVQNLSSELENRFIGMASKADNIKMKTGQLRRLQKEKAQLRDELMELRESREDIARQMDAVRKKHEEASAKAHKQQYINDTLQHLEMVLEQGSTKAAAVPPENRVETIAGLDGLLSSVTEDMCGAVGDLSAGGGTSILEQVKEMNRFLEAATEALRKR